MINRKKVLQLDTIYRVGANKKRRKKPIDGLKNYKGGVARKTSFSSSSYNNSEVSKFFSKKEDFLNKSFKEKKDYKNIANSIFLQSIKPTESNKETVITLLADVPRDHLASGKLGFNTIKIKGNTIKKRVGIDTAQVAQSITSNRIK